MVRLLTGSLNVLHGVFSLRSDSQIGQKGGCSLVHLKDAKYSNCAINQPSDDFGFPTGLASQKITYIENDSYWAAAKIASCFGDYSRKNIGYFFDCAS